jgi:hypothetical protein
MAIFDKLTIINNALIATGNEPVTTDDGSAQWIAGSTAYDRALPSVLYKHNWPFQTALLALGRLGTSAYPGYTDIYAKPTDCLHLENVWRTDLAALVVPKPFGGFYLDGSGVLPPPLDYKIIGDQIHCAGPYGVTALYVQVAVSGNWPPGFVETLTREIESFIYQGLNEDIDAAKMAKVAANTEMAEARAKIDAESPRKVAFRSRFLERRKTRITGWWG